MGVRRIRVQVEDLLALLCAASRPGGHAPSCVVETPAAAFPGARAGPLGAAAGEMREPFQPGRVFGFYADHEARCLVFDVEAEGYPDMGHTHALSFRDSWLKVDVAPAAGARGAASDFLRPDQYPALREQLGLPARGES